MTLANAACFPLRTAADELELSTVTRRRELLPWLAFRFVHIRLVYNWAWDPDRFDWGPGAIQYRVRDRRGRLAGGYRMVFPQRSLDEAMTPALPVFRDMVRPEVWSLLAQNLDLVAEVSRFVIAFHRVSDRAFVRSFVRLAIRGIFWEQARLARPLCLVVVNPFLLSRYRKSSLVLKVLGARTFPAATRFEREAFGAEVPHYVALVNSALSAQRGADDRLTEGLTRRYLFDGLDAHTRPFHAQGDAFLKRVQSVWDAIDEAPDGVAPRDLDAR